MEEKNVALKSLGLGLKLDPRAARSVPLQSVPAPPSLQQNQSERNVIKTHLPIGWRPEIQ